LSEVTTVKVALYARYSSDNQRDASIADQLRVCRTFAERQGWTICEEYTDHAVSGATLLRAGFQALMRDALSRRFDVVLAESLDRFSRDQEDTAGLFKRLTFAGVNIVTIAEGDITHLHIGFKGTMNALFLKDLAEKTHRGLRGRVEDSKSAGGLCYGYRVVKTRMAPRSRPASARSRRTRPGLSSGSSASSSLACHRSRSPRT
jgi:DNA invertase Pin-like site-specific DNA recombinase